MVYFNKYFSIIILILSLSVTIYGNVEYNKTAAAKRLIELGNKALKSNDVNQALEYFEKAIEADEEHHAGYYLSGITYLFLKQDLQKAEKRLLIAEDLNSYSYYPKYALGRLYFEKKQFSEAILFFSKAIQTIDNRKSNKKLIADCSFHIANCYAEIKETSLAIEYFNHAIRYNAELKDAYYNLGQMYYNVGLFSHAKMFWERLFLKKPEDFQVVNKMIQVCHALNLYQKAEIYIKHLKSLYNNNKNTNIKKEKEVVIDQFIFGNSYIYVIYSLINNTTENYYSAYIYNGEKHVGNFELQIERINGQKKYVLTSFRNEKLKELKIYGTSKPSYKLFKEDFLSYVSKEFPSTTTSKVFTGSYK